MENTIQRGEGEPIRGVRVNCVYPRLSSYYFLPPVSSQLL